jgi:hypothetical protein
MRIILTQTTRRLPRSKPEQAARITGQGTGERSVKFIRNQVGDPRFLDQVQKCVAHRRVLLQLDLPTVVPDAHPQEHLSLEERRARLLAVIASLQERQAAAAGSAASDGRERGHDCIDCLSKEAETGRAPDVRRLGHV